MTAVSRAQCMHCGLPAKDGARFCCSGCEQVNALITEAGLERYYALRGRDGQPAPSAPKRSAAWIEPLEERVRQSEGACRLELDVQGLHCSACVWLIEQLFERQRGGVQATVNPTLGRASLVVRPEFDLASFADRLARFGYLLGPARRADRSVARGLLLRLGVCAALTMNAMIFSFAIYAGLAGELERLFHAIDFVLATLVVLLGGSVFFRAALAGIERRVLHLDLPIALGMAAAYAGSVASWRTGSGAPYFDTVCVFVTLMLLGRFLQERQLERNRRLLLEGEDASALLTRKMTATGASELSPCVEIQAGDRLLVMPGDLFPVDARVEAEVECSLDWMSGESQPRAFRARELVPAGAFSCSSAAVVAVAATGFEESALLDLLRTPARGAVAGRVPFWEAITKRYVVTVLLLALVGFFGWLLFAHDAHRALAVATAILVVTCPCAFGIATPLAYDLAHARLRRAGLFVRTPDFLDRAATVTRVAFDKTGTLTRGELRLEDSAVLASLDPEARTALATLSARSGHPKSAAIAAAVRGEPADVRCDERAGEGIACDLFGSRWRLGRGDSVALSRDGATLATFELVEELREDAREEIAKLRARGLEISILSGDSKPRVLEIARACGVEPARALGELSPWDKAAWLGDHPSALVVGDGVNDLVAVERAHCSGTPAVDRPFVASRSDFYFVTPGLEPVRLALELAERLRGVVRRNLRVALAYNALAVGLALAGLMSPLVCAVLMPISSLSTVAFTVLSMKRSG